MDLEYPLNPEILRRNAELICEIVGSKVDVDLFYCVDCKQSHLRFIAVDSTARKIIRTKYIPSTRSITSHTDPRTHITNESIIDDTGRGYSLTPALLRNNAEFICEQIESNTYVNLFKCDDCGELNLCFVADRPQDKIYNEGHKPGARLRYIAPKLRVLN
jgi:hypothetical protein